MLEANLMSNSCTLLAIFVSFPIFLTGSRHSAWGCLWEWSATLSASDCWLHYGYTYVYIYMYIYICVCVYYIPLHIYIYIPINIPIVVCLRLHSHLFANPVQSSKSTAARSSKTSDECDADVKKRFQDGSIPMTLQYSSILFTLDEHGWTGWTSTSYFDVNHRVLGLWSIHVAEIGSLRACIETSSSCPRSMTQQT